MKYDRLVILGSGASGKDYLKAHLRSKPGFRCSVSYTTRPMRTGEIDGISYNYTTESDFLCLIEEGAFREWNKFADRWYYGTAKDDFKSANLFIMTPSGVRALSHDERVKTYVIYIDIPEHIRESRLLERGGSDDPARRLETDRIDFAGFADYDERITDPDFDVNDVERRMRNIIRMV